MDEEKTRYYEFGDYRLDTVERVLIKNGLPVPLKHKVFELLLVLVQNNGRLISHEELLQSVWRDTTVSPTNLKKNIYELRQTLGENSETDNFITTLPKLGYRFNADVISLKDEVAISRPDLILEKYTATDITIEQTEYFTGTKKPSNKKQFVIVTGIISFLIIFAVGFWLYKGRTSGNPSFSFVNMKMSKLTHSGNIYAPIISPDGKYVAYILVEEGLQSLCIKRISTGGITQITEPSNVFYWALDFTPDSDYLYYVIADDGQNAKGTLFQSPSTGGQRQKILDKVNGSLSISPDGKRFAFVRNPSKPDTSSIFIANIDGSGEQAIADFNSSTEFILSTDWSPDSQTLAYAVTRRDAQGSYYYLAEIPADGGTEKKITNPQREKIIDAIWLSDASGLIMNAIEPSSGLPQLWHVTYKTSEIKRITNDLETYKDISITTDSTLIVAQQITSVTHIWLAPGDNTEQAKKIVVGNGQHGPSLAWTQPDEILYDAFENGTRDLWKSSVDGNTRQQLTSNAKQNYLPTVSPDNRFIAFVSTRNGNPQIWRMNADGSNQQQLTSGELGVTSPRYSPDGKIYYEMYVGSHRIYEMSENGGEGKPAVDAEVLGWDISPDGKFVAYSYYDKKAGRNRLAVRLLNSGEIVKVFEIATDEIRWTRDGKALTYRNKKGFWSQPLTGGEPKLLSEFKTKTFIAFEWSPDGKSIVFVDSTTSYDAALISLK